jgi:hypothetical protein
MDFLFKKLKMKTRGLLRNNPSDIFGLIFEAFYRGTKSRRSSLIEIPRMPQ